MECRSARQHGAPTDQVAAERSSSFTGKEWLKSFAQMMSCQVISTNSPSWSQIQDRLNTDLTKVVYGKMTAAAAMQDTQKFAVRLIGK